MFLLQHLGHTPLFSYSWWCLWKHQHFWLWWSPTYQLYSCFFSFFFFLFMATPAVYGSSQARGQIRGAAVTHATTTATQDLSCFRDLHHSLCQYWVLNPLTEQGQWSNSHPHRHNIRSPTCWATMGTPQLFSFITMPLWLSFFLNPMSSKFNLFFLRVL